MKLNWAPSLGVALIQLHLSDTLFTYLGMTLEMNLYDHVNEAWTTVPVDDNFPVNQNGAPAFAHSSSEFYTTSRLGKACIGPAS